MKIMVFSCSVRALGRLKMKKKKKKKKKNMTNAKFQFRGFACILFTGVFGHFEHIRR